MNSVKQNSWLDSIPLDDLRRLVAANESAIKDYEFAIKLNDTSTARGRANIDVIKKKIATTKRDLKTNYEVLKRRTAKNPTSSAVQKCRKVLKDAEKDIETYTKTIPISAGFDWEKNPNINDLLLIDEMKGKDRHSRAGFLLVDERLNISASGNHYDKLQELADRNNEKISKRKYFVISQSDYRVAMQKKNNPGSKYHNIDASVRRGEYVGYDGNGTWRIVKSGGLWIASRQTGDAKRLTGNSLGDISKKLEKESEKRNPVTKRNSTASDFRQHQKLTLENLSKMFQGGLSGESKRVMISEYTPKRTSRLGYLVQMKVKRNGKIIPINFDGESYLTADTRRNLHACGKDARIGNIQNGLPRQGELKLLGDLVQFDYVTAKQHIENGKTVRFWHKTGEVTKEHPKLFVDHQGFPIVIAGNYDLWDIGVVN